MSSSPLHQEKHIRHLTEIQRNKLQGRKRSQPQVLSRLRHRVGIAAFFFMLACGIKYLNKVGSLKRWKLLNKLRNEQGADLIGGKDVDGNSGTGGISEVWVATEFLFRLIEVSWAPVPLGRSAGMLYRYLLYGEKKYTHDLRQVV